MKVRRFGINLLIKIGPVFREGAHSGEREGGVIVKLHAILYHLFRLSAARSKRPLGGCPPSSIIRPHNASEPSNRHTLDV